MTHLTSLASEPLSEIISFLDYCEIVALWTCGNIALNWKLSKGMVVKKLELRSLNKKVLHWPSLASQFSLDIFAYQQATTAVQDIAITSSQLSTLSRNLKNLTISAPPDVEATYAFLHDFPGHFLHLHTLKLVHFSPTGSIDFLLPHTLKVLFLGSWIRRIRVLKIQYLPPELLEFGGHAVDVDTGSGTVKFPETLQTFQLDVTNKDFYIFPLLPTCLEYLEYMSVSSPLVRDWKDIERFENLKFLNLSLNGPLDATRALMFPTSLESIQLSNISNRISPEWTCDILRALASKNSKKLKNLSGIFPSPLTKAVAELLPTTYVWYRPEAIEANAVSSMPPNTKAISVWRTSNISEISSFPPKLEILNLPDINDQIASILPHTLIALRVTHQNVKLSESQIKFLPRNLRKLSHSIGSGISDNIPIDDMAHLKDLPSNLTELSLTTRSIGPSIRIATTPESSQWLPRCLITLEISVLETIGNEWIDGLPRTIREMELTTQTLSSSLLPSLSEFSEMTELSLRSKEAPADRWQYCLDHLPPKLKRLTFVSRALGAASTLNNASLRSLPPTLTKITIPKSPEMDEACVPILAKALEEFNFDVAFNPPSWFAKKK